MVAGGGASIIYADTVSFPIPYHLYLVIYIIFSVK